MKKLTCILFGLLCSLTLYGQTSFLDYSDGKEFSFYNTTYKVWNQVDRFMELLHDSGQEARVGLESITNAKFDHLGQYVDGSYTDTPEEVSNIILSSNRHKSILYHAMRNVFSLGELETHPKLMIFVYVVVDNQGTILETATGFPISGSYVIQPQQIAALETMIRKNLTFVLDTERAAKFNYFQGEIRLAFGNYINEPTLPDGVQFIGETSQAITSLYTIRLVEDFNYFGEFESATSPSPITGLYTGELVP